VDSEERKIVFKNGRLTPQQVETAKNSDMRRQTQQVRHMIGEVSEEWRALCRENTERVLQEREAQIPVIRPRDIPVWTVIPDEQVKTASTYGVQPHK
jgi:hypothetical protein